MSSTKNKVETKSKVDTCCSEPAKRKLLIKIGVAVAVVTVLLIVIIAVAVVMGTKSEDTGSSQAVEQSNSSVTQAESSSTVTTTTPQPTTEKARLIQVVSSTYVADLTAAEGGERLATREVIAREEDSQIQWVYYETEHFAVYSIQKFNQLSQTILATTRGADDLRNNYNQTILFCEEGFLEGEFVNADDLERGPRSQNITISKSSEDFKAPSVILPLREERCSRLPQRLRFKPATQTVSDILGSTCSSVLQSELDINTANGTFPGDRCTTNNNMESICRCYKQCLDCTGGSSSHVPSCECARYIQSELEKLSCTGTDDDTACTQSRDTLKQELSEKPCSCSFGVYLAYPCDQLPNGCQDNACRLRWCYSGFRYKSPVAYPNMCPDSNSAVTCT